LVKIHVSCKLIKIYKNQSKILWKFNNQEIRFDIQWLRKKKISWCGGREEMGEVKERMDQLRYTRALF